MKLVNILMGVTAAIAFFFSSLPLRCETSGDYTVLTNGPEFSLIVDLIDKLESAVINQKGLLIKELLSKQYSDLGEGMFHYESTHDDAVKIASSEDKFWPIDFAFYRVTSIQSIVKHDNAALVTAKIKFCSPPDGIYLFFDYTKPLGPLPVVNDRGGIGCPGSSQKFEDGRGYVTYELVKQKGIWKLHFSYFTDSPVTDEVRSEMFETLSALADSYAK